MTVKILTVFLFFSFVSSAVNFFTLRQVCHSLQDPKRRVENFSRNDTLVKFLIDQFAADPVGSLHEVFPLDYIPFEALFFRFIGYHLDYFYMPRDFKPYDCYVEAVRICNNIKVLIPRLFFKYSTSTEGIARNFLIIKKLIKFVERNQKRIISLLPDKGEVVDQLSKDIKSWIFVQDFFSSNGPIKSINYFQFFSTFHEVFTFKSDNIHKLNKKKNFLLSAVYFYRMIVTKDNKLYETSHPNLPYLVGVILKMVDIFGNVIYDNNFTFLYKHYLSKFLNPVTKFNFFAKVLRKKEIVITDAKEILGLNPEQRYSLSLLVFSLERVPILCQSEYYHNILWQLKGMALIEEFLKTLKFRGLLKQ
jgi:hypothetical protein